MFQDPLEQQAVPDKGFPENRQFQAGTAAGPRAVASPGYGDRDVDRHTM